jgi:hypothetical protein
MLVDHMGSERLRSTKAHRFNEFIKVCGGRVIHDFISDGSDGASLLLWLLLKAFLGETAVLMVLFDLLQDQHQAAFFWFRVVKIQIRRNSIHYFSAKF